MDKLEMLKAAKELTGVNEINELIAVATRIQQYLTSDQPAQAWRHPLLTTVQKDIVAFASTLSIMHPTCGAVPFALYDFQRDALNQLQETSAKRIAVASGRQMGWSTMLAAHTLHYALLNSGTTQIILSPRLVNSIEFGERIKFMVECRPDIEVKVWNKNQIQFGNNSSILFRAAIDTAVRGTTIHKLVIIDAAYVSHKTLNGLLIALLPALATGAQLVLQSTPNMADDPFHDFCKKADLYIHQPWNLHPERGLVWHAEQLAQLGPARFAREHEALFVSPAS